MTKARTRSQHSRTGRALCRGALWVAVATGTLVGGAVAADEPVVIHVSGHSQLRLYESERQTPDGESFQFVVHVQLDDGQHRASAGQADPVADEQTGAVPDPAHVFAGLKVKLQLSGPEGELGTHTVITGADGHAMFPFSGLPTGGYRVTADYGGDDLRDPAHAELTVDLGRKPVSLRLEVPPELARMGVLPVEVNLRSEGEGLTGTVQLEVGGRQLPVKVTSGVGRTVLPLRTQAFLRKGQALVVAASYPGDRLHTSAQQQREVLLTSQARITLELASAGHAASHGGTAEVAQGSPLIAVGVVSDEDGPLAGEAVDLEVSEQPSSEPHDPAAPAPSEPPPRPARASASGVSDAAGRFRIVIPRLPLHPGAAVMAAVVTPRYRFILPARAAELPLMVLPPEPVSALYYVLPLLASALGALFWLVGRWLLPHLRRLGAALRQRLRVQPAPAAIAATSSSAADALPVGEPGVSLAHSRRLSGLTLRRTVDTTLDGQVLDASFGRPVAAAVIEVSLAAATQPSASIQTVRAAPDGRFLVPQLLPGHYLVVVSAPGYLPQRFPAAIPHRGELRGVGVRLEPIRVRLLEEWRRMAQRLLGQESRLRTATPRELLELFGRLRATPLVYGTTARELRHLTELVEQAYYSPRVCTPEMLTEATRLVDAILSSGAAPNLTPPGAQPKPIGSPVPLS